MGLNCGCPAGAHLTDLTIPECKESMGQIQKIAFQRIFSATPGVKNSVAYADADAKATYTALFTSSTNTKLVVSPYIQNPALEPGAARTFGGGNQTLGGIELIVGREPSKFSGSMYQESQAVIATLKNYMCENVGIFLVDENGNIGGLVDSIDSPTKFYPIPIGKLFIGDKKFGGIEEPDSNVIECSFFPNWSDLFAVVKPETGFNPLTDWVNAASV